MFRNRLLAVVVLAAVLVSVLGGLALADSKPGAGKPSERALVPGKEAPRPAKDRAGNGGPARRDKGAAISRARTVAGVLVSDGDGFVLLAAHGAAAFRVVGGNGVDLSRYAWNRVQARIEAVEGRWVVVAVKAHRPVRFVEAASKPKPLRPVPLPMPEPRPEPQPEPKPLPQPEAPSPASKAGS